MRKPSGPATLECKGSLDFFDMTYYQKKTYLYLDQKMIRILQRGNIIVLPYHHVANATVLGAVYVTLSLVRIPRRGIPRNRVDAALRTVRHVRIILGHQRATPARHRVRALRGDGSPAPGRLAARRVGRLELLPSLVEAGHPSCQLDAVGRCCVPRS